MTHPPSETDILIVGAGLAGLSAAWHLREAGKSVRIIEQSDTVGGLAATTREDGYKFDHTGHLLHLRDESIKDWIVGDLFGGDIPTIERKSQVWSSGVYTRYPYQANTYGLPEDVARECIEEYLKVLENPPEGDIRTAEDFIYRHFGKGFAKHFMIPYNEKIWGVHPRNMSASWGERFIPIPKKEEVMAGAQKGPDLKLGYNSSFHYPDEGMGELPRRMHEVLKKHCSVEFGISLLSVDLNKKVATLSNGEQVHYESLITTIPLKKLLDKIPTLPPKLAEMAQKLEHRPLYYLDVALDIPARKEFQWCYVPSADIPFYRVGIYSNISPSLAPEGKSSLYVELSSREYTPEVLAKVVQGLKEMDLITNESDIRFIRNRFIEYAYVIYNHDYAEAVPQIHKTLRGKNVYSIGRWGSWNYSSMEDALVMGRDAAKEVLGATDNGVDSTP